MGHNDGSWGAGQWLAIGTIMLLFSGVVIGLVVWAVRSYRNGSQPSQTNGASAAGPDSVLAKRFARGEIEEDEYLRRRDLLHSAVLLIRARSGGKRLGSPDRGPMVARDAGQLPTTWSLDALDIDRRIAELEREFGSIPDRWLRDRRTNG